MWHELLRDSRIFLFLLKIDRDLAEKARLGRCVTCGGPLHVAKFPRKPRGGPPDLPQAYWWRFSFCCGRCRTRRTPPSVRFLGRRVYLGAVVVLVSAMMGGITEKRADQIRELVGASVRTLRRWRKWWREVFVATSFWKASRSRFASPVDASRMPASLLERFCGRSLRNRLVALLEFLSPITARASSAMES